MSDSRSFHIRTYGCQMNVHDSEKIENLLFHAGLRPAEVEAEADVLIINTCSIRDKAENQLYSDLGKLRDWRGARPGRALGVGGCVAQQVGDGLLARFSHLDFVFGTHNVRHVPAMVDAALAGDRAADTRETSDVDRFDLPAPHAERAPRAGGKAYVTIMEGCDMFCSFCIVPTTRGREISRPAEAILAEARQLAAAGIREITLLGQTVNAYGRHDVRRGKAAEKGTMPFADLLRALDAIPGLERIRYTSPHPLFFDDDLIAAHGELEKLCPHVHLPVQSGSDRVLEAMHRRYGRARYLEIVAGLKASRPGLTVSSDLIVGFPTETEAEFEETLELIRQAGFVDSFSFKYSPRPGTRAAELGGEVPGEEAQRRLMALQSLQREQTLAYHRSRVGSTTRILVEGDSRRGAGQVMGRDPHHRVVNLSPPTGSVFTAGVEPGAMVDVDVVEATPHSLIGAPLGAAAAVRDEAAEAPGESSEIAGGRVKWAPRPADETGWRGGRPDTPNDPLRVIG